MEPAEAMWLLSVGPHHLKSAVVKALWQTQAGFQEISTVHALTLGLGWLLGPLRFSYPTNAIIIYAGTQTFS